MTSAVVMAFREYREEKMKRNTLRIFLQVMLLLAALVFPFCINIFCGLGLLTGGFETIAYLLFSSSALLFGAVALSFFRKNIAALITGGAGTFLCLYASRTHASAAANPELINSLQTPTISVVIIIALIAAEYWLSDDFRSKRERSEEQPFESIVD